MRLLRDYYEAHLFLDKNKIGELLCLVSSTSKLRCPIKKTKTEKKRRIKRQVSLFLERRGKLKVPYFSFCPSRWPSSLLLELPLGQTPFG